MCIRDSQTAFGMLLFVAVLPAFLPLPGVAGAISGPLVMLVGAQLMVCLLYTSRCV